MTTSFSFSLHCILRDDEWYVRATVTSDQPHPKASYKDQMEQAWVQRVWRTVDPGPARKPE